MWNIMKKYECMAIGVAPAGVSFLSFESTHNSHKPKNKTKQTGTRTPSKWLHDRSRCGDG